MQNERLQSLLNFTNEDLALNKQGKLSPSQISRLKNRALLISVVLGIFGLVGAVIIFMISDSPMAFVVVLVIIVIAVYFQNSMMMSELQKGAVEHIDGKVFRHRHVSFDSDGDQTITYELEVVYLKFNVSEQTYRAFEDGLDYHIYYAPTSKTILSAQLIEYR